MPPKRRAGGTLAAINQNQPEARGGCVALSLQRPRAADPAASQSRPPRESPLHDPLGAACPPPHAWRART